MKTRQLARLWDGRRVKVSLQLDACTWMVGLGWVRTQLCLHGFLALLALQLHVTALRRSATVPMHLVDVTHPLDQLAKASAALARFRRRAGLERPEDRN